MKHALTLLALVLTLFGLLSPLTLRAAAPKDWKADKAPEIRKPIRAERALFLRQCLQTFLEREQFASGIRRCLNLIGVVKRLERVADHATNIAEEVVYLYEATDIRHADHAP